VPPELAELTAALADRLDTRVQLELGARKGRMTIEFAGVEDLQRILGALEAS
jgi:ParB family chromosome partitioning protein